MLFQPHVLALSISSPLLLSCGGGGSDTAPAVVVANEPPSLSLAAESSILEGGTDIATAIGSDPEGQTLSYSLSAGRDKDLFSIVASGALSFKEAPDFEAPADADADNIYELTVQVADSQGATASQEMLVTVQNAFEGRVIDGPLSGSEVFLDLNGNGILDEGEPSGLSDIEGYFQLPLSADNVARDLVDNLSAQLVSLGGIDSLTNVELSNFTLTADLPADPSGLIAITPISSVLTTVDTDEAKAEILSALGISGTVDEFLAKDLWAMAQADEANSRALQNINQQIGLLFSTATTLAESNEALAADELAAVTEAVAKAISDLIASQGSIDFGSSTTIYGLLIDSLPANSSVSALIMGAVALNQAELNELLAGSDLNPGSLALADFVLTAQTTLQAAIDNILRGVTNIAVFLSDASISALFAGNDLFIAQTDTDGDGIFNLADLDDDGDNVIDSLDAFPLDATESVDTDGDGVGDNADTDDDNDGIPDESDDSPLG